MTKPLAVNDSEAAYTHLRDSVITRAKTSSKAVLQEMWETGNEVQEFVDDNKVYGANVVGKLAEDMVKRGVSGSVGSAQNDLYLAMRVASSFSQKKLADLADVGVTQAHVRMLVALDPSFMNTVLGEAIKSEDGEAPHICSSRALREIIDRRCLEIGEKLDSRQQRVLDTVVMGQEALDSAFIEPGGGSEDGAVVPPPMAPELGGSSESTTATPPEKGTTSSDPDPEVRHPLKVLKEAEKLATKLSVLCPDILIALEQVDKTGFDSERAQGNFVEAHANLKVSFRELQGPLASVVEKAQGYEFGAN